MKLAEYVEVNPVVKLSRGETYPFVEMGALSKHERTPNYMAMKTYSGGGAKFAKGDTVIAKITPCLQNGKRFYCSDVEIGFGSTEFVVLRAREGKADSRYLWYFMRMEAVTAQLIKSMVGATGRQRVNSRVFNEIEVAFPPLQEQKRIGDLLDAYDCMIEANKSRIVLLEEAAQRLYKEWFIDLRFPGHDDVEIVDGVPQDWEMVPISEYADIVKGCSYKSENVDVAEGVPMVNLSSIAAWGGYKPYTERTYGGAYKSEQVLKANDVVMALTEQTAGLAGYVARIPNYAEGAVPSMDLACLRPKNGCSAYLYGACRYGNVSRSLSPLANGTKIKHLKPEALGYTKLLVPPVELQGKFDCVCNPLFRDIDVLMEMNGSLQAARDRLLPKLMSGEIEVG